jgi:DNA-binding HxlR family transcriptional regulator
VDEGFDGWDEVVDRIVEGVVSSIRREYYIGIIGRMRELGASSEKLIYVYLALFQPQTSLSLRRGTGLHRNTLSEALSSLQRAGYIRIDEGALWWTSPVRSD